jgi:hypothetical protein
LTTLKKYTLQADKCKPNTRVARSKKIKKAKFGHKQFQKDQILKNEKRPNFLPNIFKNI